MLSRRVVIGLLVFCAAVAGQNPEGDSCVLKETGQTGVCTHIANCTEVLEAAYQGVIPQVCATVGTVPIVCCQHPYPSNVCPPLPRDAVRTQLTGYKTWDYCVGLAQSLYPCQEADGRWSRGNICPSTRNNPAEGPVVAGEFPHWARFGGGTLNDITWYKTCTGSLISDQWVLIGAYCLDGLGDKVKFVGLGGGSSTPPTRNNIYGIRRAVPHPDFKFSEGTLYHNIGLLQLDKKVTFSSDVFPACLHTGTPLSNEKLILGGWDDNNANSVYSKWSVDRLSQEDCSRDVSIHWLPRGIHETTQMCLRRKSTECVGGTGPVQIYNGERVGCTHMVVAVTSVRAGDCKDYVATKVSAYIPMIEGMVWP